MTTASRTPRRLRGVMGATGKEKAVKEGGKVLSMKLDLLFD